MEEMLSTTVAPVTSTSLLVFTSGASSSYGYDDIEMVADGWTSTTAMGYNSGNELTSVNADGAAAVSLGYDAWGNMTSKRDSTSSASYHWNYGGKLTGVTSTFPGEGSVTYNYGGDQKRRERDDGTVTKYRYNDGFAVLSEENSDSTVLTSRVGYLADVTGTDPAAGTWTYSSTDRLGTVRRSRDADKVSIGQFEYTPYGAIHVEVGSHARAGFTGAFRGNNLYWFAYRYYAPALARWLSRDPAFRRGMPNPYYYADANPSTLRDPLGLMAELAGDCCDLEADVKAGLDMACGSGLGGIPISNIRLLACVKRACLTGTVHCTVSDEICDRGSGVPWTGGHAPLNDPTHEITLCVRNIATNTPANQQGLFPYLIRDIIWHEFAHTCGWRHGDGRGVPRDPGPGS